MQANIPARGQLRYISPRMPAIIEGTRKARRIASQSAVALQLNTGIDAALVAIEMTTSDRALRKPTQKKPR